MAVCIVLRVLRDTSERARALVHTRTPERVHKCAARAHRMLRVPHRRLRDFPLRVRVHNDVSGPRERNFGKSRRWLTISKAPTTGRQATRRAFRRKFRRKFSPVNPRFTWRTYVATLTRLPSRAPSRRRRRPRTGLCASRNACWRVDRHRGLIGGL